MRGQRCECKRLEGVWMSNMRVVYACVCICVVCVRVQLEVAGQEVWVWSLTEGESEWLGSISRGPGRVWAGSVEDGGPKSACKLPHTGDIVSPDRGGMGWIAAHQQPLFSPPKFIA